MMRYSVDLKLELTQEAIHNLSDVMLLMRLNASRYLPSGEPVKTLIVRRDGDWRLSAREVWVGLEDIDPIVDLLRTLGLPKRQPRVTAASGNVTGWQHIWLWVSLDGEEGSVSIDLQYSGATGEDAPAVPSLLGRLLALASINSDANQPWVL